MHADLRAWDPQVGRWASTGTEEEDTDLAGIIRFMLLIDSGFANGDALKFNPIHINVYEGPWDS